jgi:hypothetical protein
VNFYTIIVLLAWWHCSLLPFPYSLSMTEGHCTAGIIQIEHYSPVSPNYERTLYFCYTVPSTWPTTEGLTLPSQQTMNEHYTFVILFHQTDIQQRASLSRLTKLWSNTIHLLYCSINLTYNRGPHSPVSPNYDLTLYICYTVLSNWHTTDSITLPSHQTMI